MHIYFNLETILHYASSITDTQYMYFFITVIFTVPGSWLCWYYVRERERVRGIVSTIFMVV